MYMYTYVYKNMQRVLMKPAYIHIYRSVTRQM